MYNSSQDCSSDRPGPKIWFYKLALEGKILNFSKIYKVVQNIEQKKNHLKFLSLMFAYLGVPNKLVLLQIPQSFFFFFLGGRGDCGGTTFNWYTRPSTTTGFI